MHFSLVDAVLERGPDRIVTIKHVSMAEEYLRDHFAEFPVLPGVFMLEAMVQGARVLVESGAAPMVLGQVRALRYGNFARPGSTLRVEVTRLGGEHEIEFKGQATIVAPDGSVAADQPSAASGKFTLRPVRR